MCNNFIQQMEIDALEQLISEMWTYKYKSRAWWFQNLPHGLQNRHRSCCRSRRRSCCWSHRQRRWGLPAPLFCPGRRKRSPRSPQCAWTASSFALRKKPCLSMAGVTQVRQLGPCAHVQLPPPGRRRTDLFHGAPRKTHGGRRARTAPLRHCVTSLSWRRWKTTSRKTDGDMAAGPPCRTSP
jgi:hypothetical protein